MIQTSSLSSYSETDEGASSSSEDEDDDGVDYDGEVYDKYDVPDVHADGYIEERGDMKKRDDQYYK